MDWQQVCSLLIVAAAAGGLVWSKLRRKKPGVFHTGHCGCSASTHASSPGSIIFHARKGQRSEVVVRMR